MMVWARPRLSPNQETWPFNDSHLLTNESENTFASANDIFPFIQIKSIDPNNNVNFPTNGFRGATFRVVTPMMYQHYTWSSSHPSIAEVNENSGVVTLLTPPENDTVIIKITAVPKTPY